MFVADSDIGTVSGWRCLWRAGGASPSRDLPNGRVTGAECISSIFGECASNEQNAHVVDARQVGKAFVFCIHEKEVLDFLAFARGIDLTCNQTTMNLTRSNADPLQHFSILEMFSGNSHIQPIELAPSSDDAAREVLINYFFRPALQENIPQTNQTGASPKALAEKTSEPRQKKWVQDKIYASKNAFIANPQTHQEQYIPTKPLWHHLSGFLGTYNVPAEDRPKTDADRNEYVGRMPPGIKREFFQYEGEQLFDRDLRESKAHNTLWAHLTRYNLVAKRPKTGPNAPWNPKLSDYVPAPGS
jgi:hypothetical protein